MVQNLRYLSHLKSFELSEGMDGKADKIFVRLHTKMFTFEIDSKKSLHFT